MVSAAIVYIYKTLPACERQEIKSGSFYLLKKMLKEANESIWRILDIM